MRTVLYHLTRGKIIAQQTQVNPIAQFIDEGSGTGRTAWPVLRRACQYAQRHRARLVVARLGKLKYNLTFLQALRGIDFFCLDDPLDSTTLEDCIRDTQERNRLLANKMRECASKKTGFVVRHHRGRPECVAGALYGCKRAAEIRTQRAEAAYQFLIPRVRQLRRTLTWDQIVQLLNDEGQLTMAGMPFNRPTLIRIMQRAKKRA